MYEKDRFSITMPKPVRAAIDAKVGKGQRSEFISKVLAKELGMEGILGEDLKVKLIAAINSVEGELTEDRVTEVLELLAQAERETAKEVA